MQRLLLPALAAVLLLAACGQGSEPPSASTRSAVLEDQYAYHVGVLAYLYGYPLVDSFRREHNDRLAQTDPALPELDPMRSLGFFEILNQQLKARPAATSSELLMAQFDAIGIGPNSTFSNAALSPAAKRGLERAIRDARVLLDAADADSKGLPGLAASHRAAALEQALSQEP